MSVLRHRQIRRYRIKKYYLKRLTNIVWLWYTLSKEKGRDYTMLSFFVIVCIAVLFAKYSYNTSNKKYEEYFEEYYNNDWEDYDD